MAQPLHSFWNYIYPLFWSSILDTYLPGGGVGCSSFSVIFLTFHTVHGVLKARILKWFAIPFSSGLRFVRTLHNDTFVLGSTTWEKAMAPHSSTLAWKIPWTEEPGRLQSMGSLRVGHDWATLLLLFTFMHWRRKWQPTLVFLPGESQGQRGLVGCRLWGSTESDTTEVI